MPLEDQRVRPRAIWYAIPVVLWSVGLVLFVLAVVAIARIVNSDVDSVAIDGSLQVPSGGLTFYTTDPASKAGCALVDEVGTRTPLDSLNVTVDISVNGPTYHGLGVTPTTLAPGSYRLTCSDLSASARLATGPRVDVTALATRALWGIFLPLVLGVSGLVVFIVLIVKRHGSRSRIKTMQAYAASGYGSAWNQTPAAGAPPPPPVNPPTGPPPPPSN